MKYNTTVMFGVWGFTFFMLFILLKKNLPAP